MRISTEEKGDRIYFSISPENRSRVRKYYYSLENIIKALKEKKDLTQYDFLSDLSDKDFYHGMKKAIYVFQKKAVDILENNVKIDSVKIEADAVQVEEQKKEASLPNTVNKTTKRKKATKSKTTEE